MLADPGANIPCIRTRFAIRYFKQFIIKNNRSSCINTASGKINPKYCLFLLFPRLNGEYYRVRFVLIDNLPCDIIADINMLLKFGYNFPNEIPPEFRNNNNSNNSNKKDNIKFVHESKDDEDLGIPDNENKYKISSPNLYELYKNHKLNIINNIDNIDNIDKNKMYG